MTDEEQDSAIERAFELFKRARPEWADRTAFNFGEAELEKAFLEWNAELQAAVDRAIPGLPQGEDRGAVLREVIDELERLEREQTQQNKLGGILGKH